MQQPVRSATHSVVSSAVRATNDDCKLWNTCWSDCGHHFGSIFGNSTSFCFLSNHETLTEKQKVIAALDRKATSTNLHCIFNTEKQNRYTQVASNHRLTGGKKLCCYTCYVLQKYKRNVSLSTELNKMSSLQKIIRTPFCKTKQKTFNNQLICYFLNARSILKEIFSWIS